MEYSKIMGGAIVLGIIAILIFSGPAQAFSISLDIKDTAVEKGGTINIDANIETGNNDAPGEIDNLTFKLKGLNSIECTFYPDGEVISGCEGITIKKISSSNSGYCKEYGYGYGCKLSFKISIETGFFDIGTYSTSLVLDSKSKETEINGKEIAINNPKKVCSIRANNGNLIANNIQFDKNRINFYIPLQNAIRGEGYITGQKERDKFLYKFNIEKILENSDTKTKVQVSGKYRIGTYGKFVNENAVLTFDRIENVTSLIGNNIKMSGMKIKFREWC